MGLAEDVAAAKAALAKAESAVADSAGSAIESITSSRWFSSRLWVTVGAIIALIFMHRAGIDSMLFNLTIQLVALFMVTRTLTDISNHWANVALGIADRKYGAAVNAPAPAPVAGEVVSIPAVIRTQTTGSPPASR